MRKIYSRVLMGALVGGGLAVLGCGIANAAETSGTDGLLSGDQGLVSVDLPVTVGGNAVSLIGDSHSEDATTTAPSTAPAPSVTTEGGDGILSGNQGLVSVDVPVTVGGNAVSVIGDSSTSDATTTGGGSSTGGAGDVSTDGSDSIGGGNQAVLPISVPVTVGGNAVSVIGDSESKDATTTGGSTGSGSGGDVSTDGSDSILGGNQAALPVQVPVTIGGNAVSVIGDSTSKDATTTGGST
ncbi:chaplin family protein, partial [Microbacterium sp. NPDC090007]|uniref:chaplin family protein n=1 Tax=Microbacterium sp. NPDC090007 TaxID=3364204 RepID=UPI0037F3A72C